MKEPFYITVVDNNGAKYWNRDGTFPQTFRLYCNPITNEFIGQHCLMAAVRNPRLVEYVFQLMINNNVGTWEHLSWERR